jgi:hypothetical protein
MGEERWQEDEEILRPLVRPERFDERAKRIGALFKGVGCHNTLFANPAAKGSARIGQHLLRGAFEQGKVGKAIPDVGKAVPAEPALKQGELLVSCEVCDFVAAQDTFEQSEMVSYALGKADIRTRGEVEFAAAGALLLQELKDLAVIRKVGNVELNMRADKSFERSLALQQYGG